MFVRALDGQRNGLDICQRHLVQNRHFDLVGDWINDGMRIAEAQVDAFALDDGLETDALNAEPFHETFTDALDHVIDQGAAQTVHGLGLGIVALAADHDLVPLDLQAGAAMELEVELAHGTLDGDLLAVDGHLDLRRDDDWLFAYARHNQGKVYQ